MLQVKKKGLVINETQELENTKNYYYTTCSSNKTNTDIPSELKSLT